MLHKLLPLGLLLASCSLLGCESCGEPEPEPACYAGTVVGTTCTDGLLLDVDSRYRIGAPAVRARYGLPDTLLGANVIAVVNTAELGSLAGNAQVGQQLHFTYVNDPNRQWNGVSCLAYDGVKTVIPRLILSNVSSTPCAPPRVE